jgi:hypothetical protein
MQADRECMQFEEVHELIKCMQYIIVIQAGRPIDTFSLIYTVKTLVVGRA